MTDLDKLAAQHLCQDHGYDKLGCLEIADPRYTMDFTEVKPGAYIRWCSSCGPEAHRRDRALTEALETRPGFGAKLKKAIDRVRPS